MTKANDKVELMYTCEDCSNRFLDYLYGLLEGPETQALLEHVDGCAQCQAALTEAERRQQLLARAAQVYDRLPVFTAPSDESITAAPARAAQPAREILPLPARSMRRTWRRLGSVAAAAAILVTVGGLYGWHQRDLDRHQTALQQTRQHVETVDAKILRVQRDLQKQWNVLPAQVEAKALYVQVYGPATYQPHAANAYRVVTQDRHGRPAAAHVTARIVDAARASELKTVPGIGEAVIHVPGDLKLESTSNVRLEVTARNGLAEETVRQELAVLQPTCTTHVALNKPAHRIGEMLFFRTLTLDRFSLEPPASGVALSYSLVDPRGRVVRRLEGTTQHGIGCGEFALSDDLMSGEYTLQVAGLSTAASVVAQAHPVHVLRDEGPQLQFDRPQYRPGETVNAKFRGRILEGKTVPQQPLTVRATAAGKPIPLPGAPAGMPLQLRTDETGKAAFQIPLPPSLPAGDAQMEVQIHDGNLPERVVQPIPVVDSRLEFEFFPEGGELVAGVPNRVYVRASGAVALEGSVLNRQKQTVAKVKLSANAGGRQPGLGSFTFVPEAKEEYAFQAAIPRGEQRPTKLPPVRDKGVVLSVPAVVSRESEPLAVTVHDTESPRQLLLVASCRGRVVDQQLLAADRRAKEVKLAPVAGTRGVVRVTVYEPRDSRLIPLAERLVYREPAQHLQLSAVVKTVSVMSLRTAARVALTVTALDEAQRRTGAWLVAAVVDEQALQLAQEHREAGLPAHFLLTSGVERSEELEAAGIVLAPTPQARQALDLFLGTQGWRRFVTEEALPDAREMARAGQPALIFADNQRARVQATFVAALAQRRGILADETQETLTELAAEKARCVDQGRLAAVTLISFEDQWRDGIRLGVLGVVMLLLAAGVLFLVLGWIRLVRGVAAARSSFVVAMGSLGLCLAVYVLTGGLRTGDDPGREERLLAWLPVPGPLPVAIDSKQEKTVAQGDGLRAGPEGLLVAAFQSQGSPQTASVRQPTVSGFGGAHAEMLTAPQVAYHVAAPPAARFGFGQSRELEDRFRAALKQQEKHGAGGFNQTGKAKKGADKGTDPVTALKVAIGPPLGGTADSAKTFYFREYAHQHATGTRDMQDTVLWHPALFAADGQITVPFELSDNVTTYRVLIYGHTATGRLGVYQGQVEVSK